MGSLELIRVPEVKGDRSARVRAITCAQGPLVPACVHLEKMPRFITGDELGNLKAYVSTNESDGTKVQCSDLLVETNKQKSIQGLAIAKSTVCTILSGGSKTY